jgi:DNA-binding MarR family transcriptional regulator
VGAHLFFQVPPRSEVVIVIARRSRATRFSTPPRTGARRAAIITVVNGIRRLERGLRLAARHIETATRLSAAQLFVLEQLALAPAESLGSLAERTFTDRSSVSAVVDRLVALRLVSRQSSPRDRRRHRLRITAAGRRVLAAAPSPPAAQLIAALNRLRPAELSGLARGLARLNELLGLSAQPARMLFEDGQEDAP